MVAFKGLITSAKDGTTVAGRGMTATGQTRKLITVHRKVPLRTHNGQFDRLTERAAPAHGRVRRMSWRDVARDRRRPQRAQPRRRIPGFHGVEDPDAPLLTPCVIEVPMAIGIGPSNKGVAQRLVIAAHGQSFTWSPCSVRSARRAVPRP